MNANELADLIIQFDSGRIYEHAEEIATMLRQQQTEIDMLKKLLDDFGITVNRKPAKYSAEWWKEVEEFNNQLRAHKK